MNSAATPQIASFIIRLVQEDSIDSGRSPGYRGSVRHIQTDCELAFTRWEEVTAFIQQFVPIETSLEAPLSGAQPEG